MTTVIAYGGGAYGTYLEWCLTTLRSDLAIVPPFNSNGNSHRFKGNYVQGMEGWHQRNKQLLDAPFVRLHPKTKQHESLCDNMNHLCDSADSVVYICPDQDSVLLIINNLAYKIWNNWWQHAFATAIDPDKIYNNWPINKTVDINDVPNWIKREFLSLYLMPAWLAQTEWTRMLSWYHPKCCVVTVSQLLYDFESSIERIGAHCGFTFAKPVSVLLPYHQENLKLQKFTNQDQICKQVVDSIVNNQHLDWNDLTLISESWVQWQLRNLGYEIRCHGLDTFPTNSIQLKELLYPV